MANINIDEELLAKQLIAFKDNANRLIIKTLGYETTASTSFFKIIIKYFILNNYEPEFILKFMRYYSLLYGNIILYSNKDTKIEEFDENGEKIKITNEFREKIINERINEFRELCPCKDFFKKYENLDISNTNDFNKYINSITEYKMDKENIKDKTDQLFYDLLNGTKYEDQFDKLEYEDFRCKNLYGTDKGFKSYTKVIHGVMIYNITYFNISNELDITFKKRNKLYYDQIIAIYLNSNIYFEKINLKMDNKNFKIFSSLIHINNKVEQLALFTFLVDNMFRNNNLKFNNLITMDKKVYYQILANSNNKMSFQSYDFLITKPGDREYKIDYSNIKEFEFEYNDRLYKFTKEGIISL